MSVLVSRLSAASKWPNNISCLRFERADSCRCLLSVRGAEFTNAQCVQDTVGYGS